MELAEARSILRQNMNLIQNLRGEGKSRKIYIVAKHWHDELLEWLNGTTDNPPGRIINAPLMIGNDLDTTKKYRSDFMIVEESIWGKLVEWFGCDHPLTRRLTIEPLTSCTVVLVKPIVLEMYAQQRVITKTMGDDWQLGHIKRPLCTFLRLISTEHTFATFDTNEPVEDSTRTADYVSRHGTKIRLIRKGGNSSLTDFDFQSHRMSPVVPSLTFSPTGANFLNTVPTKRSNSILEIKMPRPVGLVNFGNYCYFNAPIQCLMRVPQLINFVMSPDFSTSINYTNPAGSRGEIAREFQKLIQILSQPGNQARDARALRRVVARYYTQFATSEQLDAQEMLCAIIDGLHEDVSQLHTAKDGLTPRSRYLHAQNPTKPRSRIGDMFYGSLETTLKCPKCLNEVRLYDPFLCLSLPIPRVPDFQSVTLMDCIHLFLKSDKLEGDNQWMCEKCRSCVSASKCTTIYDAPPVLLFHLKRFVAYQRMARKVDTAVDYPDMFDMASLSKRTQGRYRLIGVVNHSGTLSSGHYTSAALDQSSGKWYSFNDASVAPASKSVIHSGRAYLLFYERIVTL